MRGHRGAIMILALLAVAIAFVLGMTFVASTTPTLNAAGTLVHHAQARQIAESGLGVTIAYVERTPNWRAARVPGVWVDDLEMLGGKVHIEAAFEPDGSSGAIALVDSSFETQTATLPTPILTPPMSGTVGGWNVQRTAVLQTGATVPRIGTQAASGATMGANAGFVSFTASVNGSGTFSQLLTTPLVPRTRYELSADITTSTGVSNFTYGMRVLAGGVVVATTETAWTLTLPSDPGAVPTPPQDPLDPNEYQALLTYAGLGAGVPATFTLAFATDSNPPAGNTSIELFAEASRLLTSVSFDNIRFVKSRNEPLTLTETLVNSPDAS